MKEVSYYFSGEKKNLNLSFSLLYLSSVMNWSLFLVLQNLKINNVPFSLTHTLKLLLAFSKICSEASDGAVLWVILLSVPWVWVGGARSLLKSTDQRTGWGTALIPISQCSGGYPLGFSCSDLFSSSL